MSSGQWPTSSGVARHVPSATSPIEDRQVRPDRGNEKGADIVEETRLVSERDVKKRTNIVLSISCLFFSGVVALESTPAEKLHGRYTSQNNNIIIN